MRIQQPPPETVKPEKWKRNHRPPVRPSRVGGNRRATGYERSASESGSVFAPVFPPGSLSSAGTINTFSASIYSSGGRSRLHQPSSWLSFISLLIHSFHSCWGGGCASATAVFKCFGILFFFATASNFTLNNYTPFLGGAFHIASPWNVYCVPKLYEHLIFMKFSLISWIFSHNSPWKKNKHIEA